MNSLAFSPCTPLRPRTLPTSTTSPRHPPISRISAPTLGVDYGLRRVGLAVSVGIAPRPLPRVEHSREPRAAATLVARAASAALCETIVVGLPVDAVGREGEQVEATRVFLSELAAAAPWAKVLSLDERYTSVEARAALREAGVRGPDVPLLLDSAAAVVLLNRFFADKDEERAVVVSRPVVSERRGDGSVPVEEVRGFADWKRETMERARANYVPKEKRRRR